MGRIRTRRSVPFWSAVGAIIFMTAVFFACYGPSYMVARSQAHQAFITSRSGSPDSYEFISRGITYGMTRDEVTNMMSGANEAVHRMSQSEPPWNGTVDLYIFRYGPEWKGRLCTRPRTFYEEWYLVYFSRDDLVVKLTRDMVVGNGSNVVVDLKAKRLDADRTGGVIHAATSRARPELPAESVGRTNPAESRPDRP